jgi:hypothetical protein
MKYSIKLTAFALLNAGAAFLFTLVCIESAEAAGSIVSSFQVPKSGAYERYLNGIIKIGNNYLLCDSWNRGSSYPPTVIEVNTAGSIIGSIENPTGAGYIKGLAYRGVKAPYGECIFVNANETCHTYLMTTAGSVISSFAPGFQAGDLTWDGTYLYTTNPATRRIFRFYENGSLVSSYDAPDNDPASGRTPFGLGHDGQYLWVGCYGKNDRIYKVVPGNGSVVSSFPVPNAYAHITALTADGGYIQYIDDALDVVFVVDK